MAELEDLEFDEFAEDEFDEDEGDELSEAEQAAEDAWLAIHSLAAGALAAILLKFFAAQAQRIMETLNRFPAPDDRTAAAALDIDGETALLVQAIETAGIEQMTAGATDMLAPEDGELPAEIIAGIAAAWATVATAGRWTTIIEGARAGLVAAIGQSKADGLAGAKLQEAVEKSLKELAKFRAEAIGSSEATAMLNAGRQAVLNYLPAAGLRGKVWLALFRNTRQTHAALHGVVVPIDGGWALGGVVVPYPAHHTLPAAEAVNCQCRIEAVAATADEVEREGA